MFSTNCTHKNCYKNMTPYIDPKTDKVYCEVCDNELTNITYFTKSQMKALKQYKKKSTTSFSVKCSSCGKEDRPSFTDKDVICPFCKKPHSHLSEPFKLMLRDNLKNFTKDV
jgi:hypothetical protein